MRADICPEDDNTGANLDRLACLDGGLRDKRQSVEATAMERPAAAGFVMNAGGTRTLAVRCDCHRFEARLQALPVTVRWHTVGGSLAPRDDEGRTRGSAWTVIAWPTLYVGT
jgi:hypothetical protein